MADNILRIGVGLIEGVGVDIFPSQRELLSYAIATVRMFRELSNFLKFLNTK
jgi:hypothetical protein